MCKKNYAPLHNHSHYSTLDGYGTIEEYVKAAKDLGFKGIGLTDHGTASGLYKFVNAVQDAGLIPVPGLEFYVAPENSLGAKAKHKIYYGEGGKQAPKYDVSKGAYLHLTVFAYNNIGLSNLFKLTSMSYEKEHFYHNPRIDTNMLAEHSEGLIVTSGCPSSEISRRFLLGQDDKAYEYAHRLQSIFGENFYVEIMDHNMKDEELERILVPKQIKLARDLGVKIIATNDSHYVYQSDAFAHEHILALNAKSKMTEKPKQEGGTRWAFSGPEYHIKTYDEMYSIYPEDIAEEALANTLEIVEKCKDIKFSYNAHLRPVIEIPEGYSEATYLQKLIYDGFLNKRGHQSKEIQAESVKRIKEEFEVLHSNDFISYFLVVHDYINFAHQNGIGVGAGRGSVGGSEIAYVLDISNTDPIRFDLLFERFLSPGRGSLYQIDYTSGESEEIAVSSKKMNYNENKVVYVHELKKGDRVNFNDKVDEIANIFVKVPGSAPDVDTDFHTKGREDVFQYCIDKYGEEKVAKIVSFGTFKAKKAWKAMCTLYNIPFALANKVSNAIPGNASDEPLLDELFEPSSKWYKEGADFRAAVEGNPVLEEAVKVGSQLKGRISEVGLHPCGVIISNTDLRSHAPTFVKHDTIKDPDTGKKHEESTVITQWEYPELEDLGFIKMDLLGLELIDTIQQAEENIVLANQSTLDEKYKKEQPNMRELIDGPMDDEATYKITQEGHTVAIFQLGSPGVRELLKMSKPSSFMEIANITALYRPGPMKSGAHIQYANRKSGEEEISYIHPDFHGTEVEEVLKETFGLMIFQEQIMLIAGRYAGFTPYETDKLRKAVGKKKMKIMMAMKPKFVEGCIKKGASKEAAEILWDTIEVFGEYGFNKSHSVSYAINIYQALYLKAHFPAEFMAAAIQQGTGSPEKLKAYIQEAKRMKLKIGPVDINTSQVKMSSTGFGPNRKYDIVYGFSGIKQINNELSKAIVDERVKNGPYKSVPDFVERILKTYNLGQAILGNLALAGAFDCFGISRKLVKEKAAMLIDSCSKKAAKGASLFDLAGTQSVADTIVLTGEDFTYSEKLEAEADVVGMFLSGHPTSNLGHIARSYNLTTFNKLLTHEGRSTQQMVAGTITEIKSKLNKSGKRTIFITVDDGETSHSLYLTKQLIDSIQKGEEIEKMSDEKYVPNEKLKEIMQDDTIAPIKPIKVNKPYAFLAGRRGFGESAALVINKIVHLNLAPNGSLPYEVIAKNETEIKQLNELVKKHKDKNGFYLRVHTINKKYIDLPSTFKLSIEFIREVENLLGVNQIVTKQV